MRFNTEAMLLNSVILLLPPVTGGWYRNQALSKQHTQVLLPSPPLPSSSARLVLIHPSLLSSRPPSFRKPSLVICTLPLPPKISLPPHIPLVWISSSGSHAHVAAWTSFYHNPDVTVQKLLVCFSFRPWVLQRQKTQLFS